MESKALNNTIASNNHKGYLYKWTNYLKGYQKRWFVLQNGLLSYYRNEAEMAHICRGTINMVNAKINVSDSTSLVISHSSMQTFHLKAPNEIELKSWASALISAQKKAQDLLKGSEFNESEIDSKVLLESVLFKLKGQIDNIKKSYEVLNRKSDELHKSINELEKEKNSNMSIEMGQKLKNVKERATVFRVSAANILSVINLVVIITSVKWHEKFSLSTFISFGMIHGLFLNVINMNQF